jgi:hypothetical protein
MLWGFADSVQLVIIEAESAREALSNAEKHWLEGQTITPLATLPRNAPEMVNKRIYVFDDIVWSGDNNSFFEELKSCP